MPVDIVFWHGLGDAVNLTHLSLLYRKHGIDVRVCREENQNFIWAAVSFDYRPAGDLYRLEFAVIEEAWRGLENANAHEIFSDGPWAVGQAERTAIELLVAGASGWDLSVTRLLWATSTIWKESSE